ncbi:unnamed protein product [Spirodela intermedia]|uniref:Signal peptidase complex subunit 2 n=1 Tax=Spirodela intermedia TaxID=51605 RepID=A0A7I8JH25_SPIIN|nr:unnamed protein product [Spirodela intermedia]CAA6668712.1 unnamed protein product [Spirodela intermedia]
MANDSTGGGGGSSSEGSAKNTKKANLLDQNSVKHLLDETISEMVTNKGYPEDVRLSNLRLLIGAAIIATAVLAQFYPKKYPGNKDILFACIGLYPSSRFLNPSPPFLSNYFILIFKNCCHYIVFNVFLLIISYTKEKSAILFTHPPSHWLVVASKFPRFSDMYTLTISSADPKSILAKKPVHLTKTVTKWFTKDGVLVEALLLKDVEKLIDDYTTDRKTK